jgi:hypothetical protein
LYNEFDNGIIWIETILVYCCELVVCVW